MIKSTVAVSLTLLTCLLTGCTSQSTRTPVPNRDETIAVMRKAADYQLAEQKKKKHDSDWIRGSFYTGVLALYDTTKDEKYHDAAVAWAEQAKWTPPKDQRHADPLCSGQTFLELYMLDRQHKRMAPFRAAVNAMIADPEPGREEWWWCDALYMAPPAFVRLAHATGDDKYNDFMNQLYWDSHAFLYDKDEHLFYRDKNYFPPAKTKNGKKVFWSRGNGWVMGGIPRVLQYLPKDDPHHAKFVQLHRDMSAKLRTLQGADGLWRSSLLDAEEFPMPETSGTAFFCYSMAWGINNGTLDRKTYRPVVLKAWEGLVSKVTEEGKLGYVQKVAGSPGAVKPEDTHEYAAGAFLLAGTEVLKLK